MEQMESPCNLTCKLSNEHCIGCGRSRDEIRDWTRYTSSKRSELMKVCDNRLKEKQDEKHD